MTKEELENEAREKFRKKYNCYPRNKSWFTQGYLAGAEPREKQIQIDAEQIRNLQKQNGELTDELKTLRESIKDYGAGCYENGLRNGKRKLEEQIEKMKRCEICKHYQGESCNYHSNWVKDCKENKTKLFELKEIKENDI